MAVAVQMNGSTFDFGALIKEQQRLSKQLIAPTAKGKIDPTQNLKFESGGFSFDTYVKVLEPNSLDADAQPTYQLYYRGNTNVEVQITGLAAGDKLGGFQTGIANSIFFNYDTGDIEVRDSATDAPLGQPGAIQFEAAGGLTLASVNRRLADINTALEALSRVMQVANGASEGVQGLLR